MVLSAVFLCIFPGHSFFHKEVFSVETEVQSKETQKNEHSDCSLHFYTDDLHCAALRVLSNKGY